jgi:hypothetical protein
MKETRLESSLIDLVAQGSISQAQADLILARYEDSANRQSRKSIFAEICGYLGGAFVLIAVMTFIVEKIDETSTSFRSALFAALAVVLGLISFLLGSATPMKARLSSVLALASAASATGSIAILLDMNNAPTGAFSVGTAVASFFFFRNRHEILHLGAYAFLFITSLMLASAITDSQQDAAAFTFASLFWIALASAWIFLVSKKSIQKTLGYFLASATLFFSVQSLFARDQRLYSYLLSIAVAFALGSLYLQARSWPLLGGVVLTLSISAAEFVAESLGGSLGAIIGLFVAGVALTAGSLISIRSLRHE